VNEAREDRLLRVMERVTNVLAIAVPALLLFLCVLCYIRRAYGQALFLLGAMVFNVASTSYLQRRHDRRRREWAAKMRELQRLMNQ